MNIAEIKECLREVERLREIDSNTITTIRRMTKFVEDAGCGNWGAIRILERLARRTHREERLTDCANILKILSKGLREMAQSGMLSKDIRWFDRLESLEARLEPAIVDTQSDPASIVAICFHVLLVQSPTQSSYRGAPDWWN